VGIADHLIVPDLLILYLLPLFAAAWYGGVRVGSLVALYAAGASYITQELLGDAQRLDVSSAVTFGVRLMAYLLLVQVFARLHAVRLEKEQLTHYIVHDLRSPLSSAISGLMTLEQTSEGLDTNDQELVRLALVSNQRALALVDSILDVAKLETGKMEVIWAEADLAELIEDALEPLRLWADGQQVGFVLEVEQESASVDRGLTSRVLGNLLSNAIKFSPPGSAITVSARPDHGGVRFAVQDEGPGVSPELAARIFEPFEQVQGTSGGSGLGLTFCRLAVLAQGGRIGVKSTPGHGATFWFTIPAPPAA
jgi:signal transduction histidine kinase